MTNGDLNAAIAKHWGVRPENILCGNGSDENLLLALRAFCDENTPLAFADVTYSFYTVLCNLLHIPQHILPLEDDLTIDLTKYCGLHETIVIANPNAPTSLLAPVAAIEEVKKNPDNCRFWTNMTTLSSPTPFPRPTISRVRVWASASRGRS